MAALTESEWWDRRLLRPVVTLGITQIVGFGTIYYAFGVMVVPMSAELGLSVTWAYGLLSLALLAGSLTAPLAGRMIDRHGARVMMAAGSVGTALAFALQSQVGHAAGLFAALVVMEMIAPLVLYDAAFAALAQAVGSTRARKAITLMTLMGGFASTVFWPLTLALVQGWGWREACLAFAALHLAVCLPLHLSLQRNASRAAVADTAPPRYTPLPQALHRRAMLGLSVGLTLSWAVFSAFSAQWVPALTALGLTQASAVWAGALMGPAQVGARVLDMVFLGHRHPMITGLVAMGALMLAFAVLALGPVTTATVAVFAVLFGVGQGLGTMVRGTVPLALFGLVGYAARLGRLASLRMVVSAAAPFAMAGSIALAGPRATVLVAAGLAGLALLAFWRVPWRMQR